MGKIRSRRYSVGEHTEIRDQTIDVGLIVLNRDEPLLGLAPGRKKDAAVVLEQPVGVAVPVVDGQVVAVVADRLAARSPEVAKLRQKDDERWRDMISSVVRYGQESGEFREVDPRNFAILMCSLLDGLAVQIALSDPVVNPARAFKVCMRFIADQLGFTWNGSQDRLAGNHRARPRSGAHQEGR